jgi:hypothetical protein
VLDVRRPDRQDAWGMMRFLTTCVNCHGEDVLRLDAMIDQATEITRRTFLKYVDLDELREIEVELRYETHPSRGLTMAGDWHVSYHKSKWGEKPCVYFQWSGIEHIFVEEDR